MLTDPETAANKARAFERVLIDYVQALQRSSVALALLADAIRDPRQGSIANITALVRQATEARIAAESFLNGARGLHAPAP